MLILLQDLSLIKVTEVTSTEALKDTSNHAVAHEEPYWICYEHIRNIVYLERRKKGGFG